MSSAQLCMSISWGRKVLVSDPRSFPSLDTDLAAPALLCSKLQWACWGLPTPSVHTLSELHTSHQSLWGLGQGGAVSKLLEHTLPEHKKDGEHLGICPFIGTYQSLTGDLGAGKFRPLVQ